MRSVTASAGPSTANLGHGFDVLAAALESPDLPRDRVTVEHARRWEVVLEGPHAAGIPADPRANCAALAARALSTTPLRLRVWKGLAPGSGLGSSAASAAAAAFAAATLLDLDTNPQSLVSAAAEGERASAGVPHADNASAALFGGLTCVAGPVFCWPVPEYVAFAVAVPRIELTTKAMRRVVPKIWPRAVHTRETARAVATALMLARGELGRLDEVIGNSVVERRRSRLIPGYDAVIAAARHAGAPAVTISGSGPAMVAIVDSRRTDPGPVAEAMARAFRHDARAVVACGGDGTRLEETR